MWKASNFAAEKQDFESYDKIEVCMGYVGISVFAYLSDGE